MRQCVTISIVILLGSAMLAQSSPRFIRDISCAGLPYTSCNNNSFSLGCCSGYNGFVACPEFDIAGNGLVQFYHCPSGDTCITDVQHNYTACCISTNDAKNGVVTCPVSSEVSDDNGVDDANPGDNGEPVP
jgi:hypothetical protein